MISINELSTETKLETAELAEVAGGVTLLDANMRTRYVSGQQTVSRTNSYGQWNVFVEGLKYFGLPG